ncbi:serine/threonine-protein kinase [Nocardiopsis ansamitocini]|uniref:non-specific serine/threonine protein kinase n=1 Tax=Nocardiopsis ansamitocini TaxID=1670832 RepID=A0A9W6PAD2_9ACTN|nr:serine/threonine-protein kinase [Nocardiopsis ansamitocini]GLU50070.1 serine/threonine protein kinase [Nocardiopsis ansamitocini]
MSTEHPEPDLLLVGRYRLSRLIGEGGMGRVWEGTDELLDRPVAIKELTINEHLPQQEIEILRTRMMREARSAAQLSHPSIITVFDVVEYEGFPWIVMELVRGNSLSEIIKTRGTISPARAAGIGLQMVSALAVAHQRGIVHRDIKPGNVLVAKGDRAVLTDFGIARLEGASSLTRTGNLLGSPSYLAPEQARGEAAAPYTDMWSLGTTLYAALHGSPPFQRSSPMATLTAVVTEDVPPALAAGPLRPLLEALLDKNPGNRPTVHEAAEILQEVVQSTPRDEPEPLPAPAPAAEPVTFEPAEATTALPLPPPEPEPVEPTTSAKPARRGDGSLRTTGLLVLVLLVVAGVIAAILFLVPDGGSPAVPEGAGLPGTAGSSVSAPADASGVPPEASAGDDEGSPPASAAGEEGEAEAERTAEPDDGYDGPELVRHDDQTGFAVDVPRGWAQERRGSDVFFRNPDGGYLQVAQVDNPQTDAQDDWEEYAPIGSRGFSGYEEIGIGRVDLDAMDRYESASDWEFTFNGNGGRMHAVNRGFHTKEKGYSLFLVHPDDDWDTGAKMLDEMSRSFEPAA